MFAHPPHIITHSAARAKQLPPCGLVAQATIVVAEPSNDSWQRLYGLVRERICRGDTVVRPARLRLDRFRPAASSHKIAFGDRLARDGIVRAV
jgi:hypothetical protein